MHCPIHISFRNLSVSDAVENACWREAAPLASLDGVENCRLCIESAPFLEAASTEPARTGRATASASSNGAPADARRRIRVTLEFRAGGDRTIHERKDIELHLLPGEITSSAEAEPIAKAVRNVIARALAAAGVPKTVGAARRHSR